MEARFADRDARRSAEAVYWLTFLAAKVSTGVQLLVICYPFSLFPVDVVGRFGYSPPVGLVVDGVTAAGIATALGGRHAAVLRRHFENDEGVASILEWHSLQRELTASEIEASWDEFRRSLSRPPARSDTATPESRRAVYAASLLALQRNAAYGAAATYLVDEEPAEDLGNEIEDMMIPRELQPVYDELSQTGYRKIDVDVDDKPPR